MYLHFSYWQAASITQPIFAGKNAVNKHFLGLRLKFSIFGWKNKWTSGS